MSSLCDALPLQLRPQPQPVRKRKGKESGRVIVACVWRTEANFDFSSEIDFILRRDDDAVAVAVKKINWVMMSRSIILRLAPYFASRIRQNHRLLSSSSSSASSSSPCPSSLDDAYADADAIHMTQNCVQRMKELQSNEASKSLRLTVETGGCSGFQYVFLLDDKTNPDDRIFENEGVKLVVDNISYDFVKGATVDYVEELIRAAFVVTENPSAVGGCSCKSSFMVRQ